MISYPYIMLFFFFFNDTATTEIYTLSLHDALPIYPDRVHELLRILGILLRLDQLAQPHERLVELVLARLPLDRKSTRLNSSHLVISYAVFCLKKKTDRNQALVSTSTQHSCQCLALQ